MRKTIRTYLVGLCIAVMTINPVLACCHSWGGGWGGGYYYGGPAYCGPVYSSGCCGGCYEVVVDDCCGGCGSQGTVVSEGPPSGTLPSPPAMAPGEHSMQKNATPVQPEQPAHVERPVDDTPAPKLMPTPPAPPQPAAVPLPDDESPQPPPPSNDLFNSPPPMPPTPAVETPAVETPPAPPAKAAEPMDDLFGPGPAKPAESAPAEPPAATPPQSPPATSDDLFGPAPEQPAAPAEKPAEKTEEKDKKADDIFGALPSVLREAGGLASNEMRQWLDNTGNFSCQGRLISLIDGQVRLMKDNGRTTTVPLARLSANDLRFVERQASAQHQATVLQTAQAN